MDVPSQSHPLSRGMLRSSDGPKQSDGTRRIFVSDSALPISAASLSANQTTGNRNQTRLTIRMVAVSRQNWRAVCCLMPDWSAFRDCPCNDFAHTPGFEIDHARCQKSVAPLTYLFARSTRAMAAYHINVSAPVRAIAEIFCWRGVQT